MRGLRLALLPACLVVGLCAPSYAWNKSGHMVAASLAYRDLKQNHPEKLKAWIAILKQHEHFDQYWNPALNAMDPGKRDEALFMLAARWPDDMRDPEFRDKYHRRVWHFADHAISFTGAPSGISSGILPSPPQQGDKDEGFPHLLLALPHNLEVLKGNAAAPTKAIALCWVLHLTGDLHQPLHMATRFSEEFPSGDKGGNGEFINVPPNGRALNYHSFWDDLILAGPRKDSLTEDDPDRLANAVTEASRRAAVLARRDDLGRDDFAVQLAKTALNDWADEGVKLGREVAYLNGDLAASPDHHDPTPLPAGFTKKAQAVAEQQIALAGYRLADLLDD
jgi:hypothetical protein